jgi:SLOG in TRPM, prokaryote
VTAHSSAGPRVASVTDAAELASVLREWGLAGGSPVVVLVGGADGLEPDWSARCERLLREALVPTLEEVGAVVVDGGTDAGIIALAGRARQALAARCPQVGVVARGTLRPAGSAMDVASAPIESHHSHVLAVPGATWGDEAPWLGQVAAAIALGAPTVTVLANGGDVAYDDVRLSLKADRPVLVLGGTGRAADEIIRARGGQDADPRAVEVASSALVTVVPYDARRLVTELRRELGA